MGKICCIFNIPSFYREKIYLEIDKVYDCEWYFEQEDNGINLFDTNKLKKVNILQHEKFVSCFYTMKGLVRMVWKQTDYDKYLMVGTPMCVSLWVLCILLKLFRPSKKIYFWTHGWYGKEGGLDAKMKLWLYRHASGTFVYGDRAKRLLIEQGISEEKLFAIHNSLDYDTQKALRESIHPSDIYKDHFQNNLPTIIFIGRLTKVKKLDMLVDALVCLRNKDEKYNLVFVGDGSESESLKSKVKGLGLDSQVWFYGVCYDEKTNAELIYNADLCVSPGNVGLTAMHSLVFGCPVITHNCFEWQMPEYEAIQAGVTGDFFTMDDTDDLTMVISRWFARKMDSREEVRKACFNEIDSNWNPYYQMDIIKKNLKF